VVRAPSNSRVIARFAERGDFHELLNEAVVLMGAAVANWRNDDTSSDCQSGGWAAGPLSTQRSFAGGESSARGLGGEPLVT
jgi:hypothetical protein